MNLQHRIDLLVRLGKYILSENDSWTAAKHKAGEENGWFIPEFTEHAANNIARHYLQRPLLENWAAAYNLPDYQPSPKNTGIIMAGNIPLVGFHDWLSVFISGHNAVVKPSSRDKVLINHLVETLATWDSECSRQTVFADMLKGCDAYMATGSNNSSRYFEYYFAKYPHVIRRNRTAVAILDGTETTAELEALADDIFLYFGLGCRNVTKLYVPVGYDFVPLLAAFNKYSHLADHHKYKNNYDYNLALYMLNKQYYMTNGAILLIEAAPLFSPVSQLNYEFYPDPASLSDRLAAHQDDIQCITGHGHLPFGQAQTPALTEYADGVDTVRFLCSIVNS